VEAQHGRVDEELPIQPACEVPATALARTLSGGRSLRTLTEENIQARIRGDADGGVKQSGSIV